MKRFRIVNYSLFSGVAVLTASLMTLALPALAGGTNVNVIDFAFSPASVSINVNDSVTWNWTGSFAHTSTSNPTNLWNSGILSHGATFSHTFNTAGNFPYLCQVHPTLMLGTVSVVGQTQSVPPAITAPKVISTGSFQFSYSATVGLNYAVERSADLMNWSPIATNNAAATQVTFTDTAAAASANFYRVRVVTGP